MERRVFLTATAALAISITLPARMLAQTPILSAPELQARLASGDMILLDIRSRPEWKETGLAQGAWPVSMHERDFGARLNHILETYPASQIALICATGGRTSHVAKVLATNGITGITDLSEGMMGNRRGPGWIARGLPVVSLQEATAAYEQAIE